MAMKSSGLPTRIISCRVKGFTSHMEDVDLQYQWALEYHNGHVVIELERRKTFRDYRSTIPEYAVVEKPCLELEHQLQAVRDEINMIEQKSRKRVDTPELDLKAKAIIAELDKQRALLRVVAYQVKGNTGLVAVAKEADEKAKAAVLALRLEYSNKGLTWGTRGLVETAIKAAKQADHDPVIHKRDGRGRIGVQLQGRGLSEDLKASGHQIRLDQKRLTGLRKELGKESKVVKDFAKRLARTQQRRYEQKKPENRGLPIGDLADDTRLQIVVPPEIAYQSLSTRRGDRRRAARTTGRLRIGSTPKGEPIWADFKVTMHRQLPVDGVIKYAWIRRNLLGTHMIYHLQLVIEAPSFEQKVSVAKRETAVAIDVGWRVRAKNVLRVAYLLDTAGNRREILLPETVVRRLKHADSLRSIQDDAFNAIKDRFLAWVADNKEILSSWFHDTFQFLALSRSSKSLSWKVREWSSRRFEGDSQIYGELVAWRKQFLHLYEWEVNERAGALAERKNFFQHMNLELAKSYEHVLIEDFKLTGVVENSMPEEEDDNPQTQRHNRVMSSISEYRRTLASVCSAWGCLVVELPAAYTTLDCHACHDEKDKHAKWDAATTIVHTCQEKCGSTWDQDYNAAANLLAAWLKIRNGKRAA